MKLPTIAVQHPDDPRVRMLVNVDQAAGYRLWDAETAEQAPAAEGGDPSTDAGDAAADPVTDPADPSTVEGEPAPRTRRARR